MREKKERERDGNTERYREKKERERERDGNTESIKRESYVS